MLICEEAPDPSNIKWENFTLSKKNRLLREILSFAVTLAILLISKQIEIYFFIIKFTK